MKVNTIILLSWKGLGRHKRKTVYIGSVFIICSLLMTFLNAVISGMDTGLQKNIVDQFTGDIVLISADQSKKNVIYPDFGKPIKSIKNYLSIKEVLETFDEIEGYVPAGIGYAISLSDRGSTTYQLNLGVDFEKYNSVFSNSLEHLEGNKQLTSQKGIYLSQKNKEKIERFSNQILDVNNAYSGRNSESSLVFMGLGNQLFSTDISLPIRGVIKYKSLNSFWSYFNLIDMTSYQQMMGLYNERQSLSTIQNDIFSLQSEEIEKNLGAIVNTEGSDINFKLSKPKKFIETDAEHLPFYQVVFIKLRDGKSQISLIHRLNQLFNEQSLAVKAISWKAALGLDAQLAALIKVVLMIFMAILYAVVFLVLINTFIASIYERATEFATIRAIGGAKKVIRRLIFFEYLILTLLFTTFGTFLGIGVVWGIRQLKISSQNEVLQLFFGGDIFQPIILFNDIAYSHLLVFMFFCLSMIYPALILSKIQPIQAISRD
jgi:ABC-type lipoprotein release transport system permease subunit